MKWLLVIIGLFLLVGSVNALNWTSASGCWTATDGIYNFTKWNTTGSFVWIPPADLSSVEYLVVAGGGGGAGSTTGDNGGRSGGGAGGLLNGTGYAVTPGVGITVVVGTGGSGGVFGSDSFGGNGTFSLFGTINATGGGGGAPYNVGGFNGLSGGSGGGAGYGAATTGGAGVAGQGYSGGNGSATAGGQSGGGAGGAGASATGSSGAAGGVGLSSNISGDLSWYAGGGGGGAYQTADTVGAGGSGVGGSGAKEGVAAGSGVANTGSGGGGGGGKNGNAGGNGSDGIVIIKYDSYPYYPNSSFTSNVTAGVQPLSVQFNDTSVTDITGWNWSFGDGNYSEIQNATHIFYNGNWNVHLNATNASGSKTTSGAYYITVSDSGGLSGWNRQDILMEQIYTFTLNVKDASTQSGIPDASILTNLGDNTTTNLFGVSTFTMNYTPFIVSVGKSGYYSRTVSYIVDRDRNETIYLTEAVEPDAPEPFRGTNPLYPQQIQFILVDKYGHLLTGVDVTAQMTSMSINGTNWLTELFQISTNATPIDTTILSDASDDAGTVVFPMIASGTYQLTFSKPADGISETKSIHPTQPYYIFILSTTATAAVPDIRDSVNTSLKTYPPASTNPSVVYLQANYTDTLSQTTNATFYVLYPNQTPLYTNTTTGTISSFSDQYAVNNTAASAYVWGISALRGTTYINKSTGITMKGTGQSGLANNLIKLGCNNWGCT